MDPYTNPIADLIPTMLSILSGHTKHPDSNNKCTTSFCNVVVILY